MKIQQLCLTDANNLSAFSLDFQPDLVLVFTSWQRNQIKPLVDKIIDEYPNTLIAGCSTSGELQNTEVSDESACLTAIKFETSYVKLALVENLKLSEESRQAGATLMQELQGKDLRHVFVLSDGLNINGAKLVKGLSEYVNDDVKISGGLAGDQAKFESTFVIHNDQVLEYGAVAVGFYGPNLDFGLGSEGGWNSFGVERLVTNSTDNVIYTLDNQPALELYRSYLGDSAKDLPASGLLFPLSVRTNETDRPLVRTILGIDEEKQSLTFAGDVEEGAYVRLMKANVDRLIQGAEKSAEKSTTTLKEKPTLAILISCVGRRLVLKQLVEEELEAVKDVMGEETTFTGFYSYGEIAPYEFSSDCHLHNQTMTITTIYER